MGLPNRIIEDISVSEDERHNARKDFRVTFIHPTTPATRRIFVATREGVTSMDANRDIKVFTSPSVVYIYRVVLASLNYRPDFTHHMIQTILP